MKITADTNVLISSTFWYGDSNTIIELVENKSIELVLSRQIIEEFSKVLHSEEIQNKIKTKNLEIIRTIEKIVSLSLIVEPKQKFNVLTEDPDDNKILDCAFEAKADYIVSQDYHLLKLGEFEGIKIISPRQFLDVKELD